MNIEIEMSGFDAVLNEAMKIVAPETLEAANQESGEYLRDYLASWYDNKGREHWVNNSLPTHGPGRMVDGLVFQHCPQMVPFFCGRFRSGHLQP